MKIKFVRHGETDLNYPVRRMQGISDYDLNSNGIKQAEAIRNKLAEEDFDIIISSPLKRAKHTAEIINEFKKLDIILDDRIIERNYGQLEGQLFNKDYCNLDYDFESIGGESINTYKARLKDFIFEIAGTAEVDGESYFVGRWRWLTQNGNSSLLTEFVLNEAFTEMYEFSYGSDGKLQWNKENNLIK